MAKSDSQRVMDFRKNNPDKVRLEIVISSDLKAEFERFGRYYRLTNPAMIEKFVASISYPDLALHLLATAEGDRPKAKRLIRERLKAEFPGWNVNGDGTEPGGVYHTAHVTYKSIAQAIDREMKNRNAGVSVANQ